MLRFSQFTKQLNEKTNYETLHNELAQQVHPRQVDVGEEFEAGGLTWKVIDVHEGMHGLQATLETNNRRYPIITIGEK